MLHEKTEIIDFNAKKGFAHYFICIGGKIDVRIEDANYETDEIETSYYPYEQRVFFKDPVTMDVLYHIQTYLADRIWIRRNTILEDHGETEVEIHLRGDKIDSPTLKLKAPFSISLEDALMAISHKIRHAADKEHVTVEIRDDINEDSLETIIQYVNEIIYLYRLRASLSEETDKEQILEVDKKISSLRKNPSKK